MTLFVDFETKSEADLRLVGSWAYSEHPTTDIICVCYAIDDGPIWDWVPGEPFPQTIQDALDLGHRVEAHGVHFEYAIWLNVAVRKYGWTMPAEDQWEDTMAAAAYYSMPRALEKIARALGFGGKDPAGGRLITKYSKLHLKTAKKDIPEEDLQAFVAYCRLDVELERRVSYYLGPLPDEEREVWLMDQEINRLGMHLDTAGIAAAVEIVSKRAAQLTDIFRAITDLNPTQGAKLLVWFEKQGLKLENMQKDYLVDILKETKDMPDHVRRALEIRLAVNKASTKKLDAMARQVGADGSAKYQVVYHGASTGRWTGTGFQPLNMNRGYGDGSITPENLVADIMYRDPDWLDTVYGDATEAVAAAGRHFIIARPGHRILAGDFVSIEAVILACLAGEQWKVGAFERGEKIYERMGDKIYGLPEGTVTKKSHPAERQDGKVGELAFGYQGAVGAWRNFDKSDRHTDERIVEICKAWRKSHPNIVSLWYDLERAAIRAVDNPGTVQPVGLVAYEMVDEWLSLILPDGKRIWYREPELRLKWPQWHKPEELEECATGECDHKQQRSLTYLSVKESKRWMRVHTYGGKLTENLVQATSRQLLTPAMIRIQKAKYPIILSVYDEVVSDVPKNHGSEAEFQELLDIRPRWCENWPVSSDTWEGDRYKK